ncbi:hypothetical protein Sjap_001867 [Stephania japonica]|uniref:BHLH domain-containing protein n=1 Tax=Stephania japonica TaxID=461633 RepID=A0AAP0PS38_9MAGN
MEPPGRSELYRMILEGNCSGGGRLMMYGGNSGGGGGSAAAAAAAAGSSSPTFFPLPLEMMSEITATATTHDDRALAASKNHREAEKRRRERINSHLNKLRSLLPCNSKTDKASLLGKVIEHVKELKQQTAGIEELELFPSETDEVAVQSLLLPQTPPSSNSTTVMMKASVCCEDRSDLLPDLMETLKSLQLKTVRAEMATLGGRIRNVLLLEAAAQQQEQHHHHRELEDNNSICRPEEDKSIGYVRQALNNLLDSSNTSSGRSKRRRIVECTTTPAPTNTTDYDCMPPYSHLNL